MKKLLSSLQGLLLLALPLVLVGCEDLATEDNPISAYLSINKAPVTIKVNDTFNREAIAVSGAVVEYTSSDTDVATVDEDGKVTAIAVGTATITAKTTGYSTSGKKIYQPASASYDVTVNPKTITVYVNVDLVSWTSVNFWTWGGDGTHAPTNTVWPGDDVTTTATVGGKTWYKQTYDINSQTDVVCFVFSTGTGTPQSVDIDDVNTDKYFEISTSTDVASKHLVNDVTSTYVAE